MDFGGKNERLKYAFIMYSKFVLLKGNCERLTRFVVISDQAVGLENVKVQTCLPAGRCQSSNKI